MGFLVRTLELLVSLKKSLMKLVFYIATNQPQNGLEKYKYLLVRVKTNSPGISKYAKQDHKALQTFKLIKYSEQENSL